MAAILANCRYPDKGKGKAGGYMHTVDEVLLREHKMRVDVSRGLSEIGEK